jgi:beta-lactamase regulating signal transducer with metallopeptidase domain
MTLLFTWLWQGMAIAALTTLVLRASPQVNAATRYVTWWAALVTILGIPWALTADTFREAITRLPLPGSTDRLEAAVVFPAVPGWVGVVCVSAWTLMALSAIVRVVRGWFVVRSLRHRSTPFDPRREARLSLSGDAAARARRPAQLRTSDEFAGACAIGFRRPVILVGRQLADALDDEALDQIVMHEQAHLARYDDWLRLVQAVIEAVAGLHPAVWWLSRRLDLDREAACDDRVVARTGAARQYASALLAAATTAGCRPVAPAIVPGVTAGASALRGRVARLLDPGRAHGVRPTPMASIAIALPVLAMVACPQLAPLVAFVEAVEHVLPLPGASVLRGSVPASIPPGLGRSDMASSVRVHASAGQRGAQGHGPEPPDRRARVAQAVTPATSGERETAIEVSAPAPLEGGSLAAGANVLAPTAPAGTMAAHSLPKTRGRAPWQALAISSADAAKSSASGVASGAGKSGLAVGRAFTRAAQAIAAGF